MRAIDNPQNLRMDSKRTCEEVLQEIKEQDILAVRFEQTDMNGIARSKTIPSCHFREKATGGLNFYLGHVALGVQAELIEGAGYNEETGYADAVMFPDYDTFQVLPWVKRTGRILTEPTYKGKFVGAHPRVVARKQLEQLKTLGLSLFSAHEHEFYLLDKETLQPFNNDVNAHSTIRGAPVSDFLNSLIEYLPKVGVNVECVENEYGPGQVEISYKPAFGIRAADNAHTYKTSIKEIALLNGYVATFMSKPYLDKDGSSCHFCHSLWDLEGKTPLLYDSSDPQGLSQIAKWWIAGLLAHSPAIHILMEPTVNCLKRTQPFKFCPVNATWGMDNRSCAIRVKVNGGKGTYIENRMGASGCNPYLVLAATVAAGMDGITNRLPLPPECTGNAYMEEDLPPKTPALPNNTEDALQALLSDEVIREALGEDFIKCFSAIRINEAKVEKEALEKGEEDWDFNYFYEYL
ncbi:lengsin-like [Diadema setosum]|uniref:lengsin-like n=1 Tax=Diadema setosum TaxID=31175 RepID=UPI003B3A04DD